MPIDIDALCSWIGDEYISGRIIDFKHLTGCYPELSEPKIQKRFVVELKFLASTAQSPELAQKYYDLISQIQPRHEGYHANSRQKRLREYLEKRQVEFDELFGEQQVNEQFFRVNKPLLPNHRASYLYGLMEYKVRTGNEEAIILDGYSTRAVILALVKIIAECGLFPTLRFQIGNTHIMCQTAPPSARQRQKANVIMHVLELRNEYFSYGYWEHQKGDTTKYGVGRYLDFIVGTDEYRQIRTMRLMELMKEKSRNIASFTIPEFDNSGLIRTPDPIPTFPTEDIIRKIHYLNGLNFLRTVVEITRRLYRENGAVYQYAKENPDRQVWLAKGTISDEIPVAILQARACKLLEEGFIDLNEVFGNTPQYGVVTCPNTIERIYELQEKARRINDAARRPYPDSALASFPPNTGRRKPEIELASAFGTTPESTPNSSYERVPHPREI